MTSEVEASLAFTWWGHATTTVELGGLRVGLDPLLTNRLAHLRRYAAPPGLRASEVDLILVSHAHLDHLHVPSLRRFDPSIPVVVPRGAERLLRGSDRPVIAVGPGSSLEVNGAGITVLEATHDERRHRLSRLRVAAVGYRVAAHGRSFWYPGDSDLREDMADVASVDLAVVPVGGWGPTLAWGHMNPDDAAIAAERVDATWAVPVHWGTYWPAGLSRVSRRNHQRMFASPGPRFVTALTDRANGVAPVLARHGERVVL